MKKLKHWFRGNLFCPLGLKITRIMRLTVLLSLIGISQILAVSTYSQTTRLSVQMQDARMLDVLASIEEQSEFYFLYSKKLVDVERQVTVEANNALIDEILKEVFRETDIEYLIMDRQIILSPMGMIKDYSERVTQQQKTVSGTVTDEAGEPLPGVTVIVKGTTQGTVTNADGEYSLRCNAGVFVCWDGNPRG